jgi:hypothetical protein
MLTVAQALLPVRLTPWPSALSNDGTRRIHQNASNQPKLYSKHAKPESVKPTSTCT